MAIGKINAMKLTLDKMNRLVVPKAVRDRYGLTTGDELELTLEADGIRMRPAKPTSPLTEKEGVLLCASEVPAAAWDIPAFIDAQRGQRASHVTGL